MLTIFAPAGMFRFAGCLFLRFGLLAAPALAEDRSERREYQSYNCKKKRRWNGIVSRS